MIAGSGGSAALLQLASPALPIGGYSYSGGLEWGIDCGQVRDEAGALEWMGDALALGQASFDGPLMVAALRAARGAPGVDAAMDALAELNEIALAARETAELRLESQQMGYSLGRWLAAVCPQPADDALIAARLEPLSLPVGWAIAASRLALTDRDALLALFWTATENQAMVLMKAVPMGQIAAQRLLRRLGPAIDAAIERALALPRADWSSAAPLLAVASARHETQYSRLFRS
jgi:urease accessory protein